MGNFKGQRSDTNVILQSLTYYKKGKMAVQ